jgi:hypothetical protein
MSGRAPISGFRSRFPLAQRRHRQVANEQQVRGAYGLEFGQNARKSDASAADGTQAS